MARTVIRQAAQLLDSSLLAMLLTVTVVPAFDALRRRGVSKGITALTGLGFSIVVYVLMLAVGTDLALVWAVLAFLMNYVPNVGIILSVV
ncbi:MAG: hypothetical protein H0X69_05300, partial [Gemmatimonadales bacterium]|nr:hypothetical protein [Gemmatimonadales bacterium]